MKYDNEAPDHPADAMNIAQAIAIIWAKWKVVLGFTLFATLVGVIYSLMATPRYYSEATIGMKESGKSSNASNVFSQLGGLGGAVASQLGVGNTNLNKIEIILKGHELAESVIVANNLMPILFSGKRAPSLSSGAEYLRKRVLSVQSDVKKGVIQLGITVDDPVVAKKFVDYYISGLNAKIRADAIAEAEQNREFLERQLQNVTDPILVEKINGLIAVEIEKMMFVSSQPIEILDRPMVPLMRSHPARSKIVVIAFFIGMVLSIVVVFAWVSFGKLMSRVLGYRFNQIRRD